MIKTVIIDDHQMIVDGLKRVLESRPEISVIASAPTLSQGVALARDLEPNVIILDVRLADSAGLKNVKAIRQAAKDAFLIVMTGFGEDLKEEALANGADAFLSKENASDQILKAIERSGLVRSLPKYESLTSREDEIIRLVAAGHSNPEIAEALCLSVNTVKTHLTRCMVKLGVHERVSLVNAWRSSQREKDE